MLAVNAIQEALQDCPEGNASYHYYLNTPTYAHWVNLRHYDGYLREAALRYFLYHEEDLLFPELLERLSDYVEVNRALAKQHLTHWLTLPSCAELCLTHFLVIMNIYQRERADTVFLDQLLSLMKGQLTQICLRIQQQQGQLVRQLFLYLQQQQWLTVMELVQLAKTAVDQKIRQFYIEYLMQQNGEELLEGLQHAGYRDVQDAVLQRLIALELYRSEALLIAWQSRFMGILDLAAFYLKKDRFDFEQYFLQQPTDTQQQIQQQLKQMIVLKWQNSAFLQLLSQVLEDKQRLAMLKQAYHQQYCELNEVLDFLAQQKVKYPLFLLQKFKKMSKNQMSIGQADAILSWVEQVSFAQRLAFLHDYSFWDRLYWATMQWAWCVTAEDKQIFMPHLAQLLKELEQQYYPPSWSAGKKQSVYAKINSIWYNSFSTAETAPFAKRLENLLLGKSG